MSRREGPCSLGSPRSPRLTQITGASAALDLEGIAVGTDGQLWLASEGNAASACRTW